MKRNKGLDLRVNLEFKNDRCRIRRRREEEGREGESFFLEEQANSTRLCSFVLFFFFFNFYVTVNNLERERESRLGLIVTAVC